VIVPATTDVNAPATKRIASSCGDHPGRGLMSVVGALVEQRDRQTRQRHRRRRAQQPREPLGLERLREERERDDQGAAGEPLDRQDHDVVHDRSHYPVKRM
jgi:hypothetical protein